MSALAVLLEDLPVLDAVPDIEVAGITDDSRDVQPGDLFVAVAGAASDGHQYAAQAVANGAVAVLAERALPELEAPVVLIDDLKRLRSELASRLYRHPSRDLHCVGVTGTNGKTSIACFIAELAMALGMPAGYMGTIGWGTPGEALAPSNLTTESAIIIQRRLAEFRDQDKRWAVLEASSHALDQHRLDGVTFEYAVFSNLSRDHLDYHQDFESYGRAKARLFRFPELKAAIINTDDAFGRRLADGLDGALAVIRVGESGADVRWEAVQYHPGGVRGRFATLWGTLPFELPLFGSFSVANVAAAVAVLCHSGATLEAVVATLPGLESVPGRMEFFHGAPTIVVDYAHTPDALEKMLLALRPHVVGSLICVCGCGGDRDRGKRPLMAQAATALADRVWLTSDNPRSEDPVLIIDDMLAGIPRAHNVHVQVDRGAAIREAVASAGHADLVVVAGKGHEDYQEVQGRRLPFSDRRIAAEITSAGTAGPVSVAPDIRRRT